LLRAEESSTPAPRCLFDSACVYHERRPQQPPYRFGFLLYFCKRLLWPVLRQVNSREIVMGGRKCRAQFQCLSKRRYCFLEVARIIGVGSQVEASGRAEWIQFHGSAMQGQGPVQSAQRSFQPAPPANHGGIRGLES